MRLLRRYFKFRKEAKRAAWRDLEDQLQMVYGGRHSAAQGWYRFIRVSYAISMIGKGMLATWGALLLAALVLQSFGVKF